MPTGPSQRAIHYKFVSVDPGSPRKGAERINLSWVADLPGDPVIPRLPPSTSPTEVDVILSNSDFRTYQVGRPTTGAMRAYYQDTLAIFFIGVLQHEMLGHAVLMLPDRESAHDNGLMSYGGTSPRPNDCFFRDIESSHTFPLK